MGITRTDRGNLRRWRTGLVNWLLPRRAFKFFLRDREPLKDLDRVADAMGSLRQSGRLRPVILPGREGDGSRSLLHIQTTNPSVPAEPCSPRARQEQASLCCS